MFRMRLLLLPLLLLALRSVAQDAPPVKLFEKHDLQEASTGAAQDPPAAQGEITIHADPKIDRLMQLHGEHKHTLKGYRVQIYLGERRTAEDTKRTFLQKHPDTPVYMSWLAPNFRLRIGDLRTRLEAERLLRDLKVEYPGSYIVPDDIEMPKITARQ